jgi:hypothetical protein
MFRMDAALRFVPLLRETVREATGSPDSMYAWTIEWRISAVRCGNEDCLCAAAGLKAANNLLDSC